MAFEPCTTCQDAATAAANAAASVSNQAAATLESAASVAGEVVDDAAALLAEEEAALAAAEAEAGYTVTWDMPDTSKEKAGVFLAGALAFLAPFVGFAVAASVGRKSSGYLKPVGAGALTFFAMRAAAVGVLHVTDNLPSVSTASALGAMMPQVPRLTQRQAGTRVYRGGR
jgi:hypothetical protein